MMNPIGIVKARNLFRGVGEVLNGRNVRVNGVLRGSSGFVRIPGSLTLVYFNTEDPGCGILSEKILIRTAKDERDFVGGFNHFVSRDDFVHYTSWLANNPNWIQNWR